MMKPLNVIVACSENRVIGRAGQLPWRIAEDWKFFKHQTAQKTVILGRISFESWRSVLDDERRAIVLTQNTTLARDRVTIVQSLTAAIAQADAVSGEEPIYICGGQRIFEEAIVLPRVQRLYLTLIHAQVEGDRYFPDWRAQFPTVISARDGADENFRYTFYELGR
jgi:dihydrofolate reductase